MTDLTIEELDVDGAIREGAEAVQKDSRAGFMATAAVGAAGLVGGGALLAALPGVASAASANDVAILNFALTLEYLERDFYNEAVRYGGAGKGAQRHFALVARGHENAHVQALKKVLGRKAIKQPKFNFRQNTHNETDFRKTAITLEDTGVKAYKGQAPLIQSTQILAAALAIHSVEADHAAWIRRIDHQDPTYTGAFELPLTRSQVLTAVANTGFIVG